MLDLPIDEEETSSSRHVDLQRDAENMMEGVYKQQGCFIKRKKKIII